MLAGTGRGVGVWLQAFHHRPFTSPNLAWILPATNRANSQPRYGTVLDIKIHASRRLDTCACRGLSQARWRMRSACRRARGTGALRMSRKCRKRRGRGPSGSSTLRMSLSYPPCTKYRIWGQGCQGKYAQTRMFIHANSYPYRPMYAQYRTYQPARLQHLASTHPMSAYSLRIHPRVYHNGTV